jgi:hypothetical protein
MLNVHISNPENQRRAIAVYHSTVQGLSAAGRLSTPRFEHDLEDALQRTAAAADRDKP